MDASITPTLTLDRISKLFGGTRALDRVSATFHPGEFVAVIGKSGAGKTTLLRCLSGSTPVGDGVIRFRNQDLTALSGAALRAHRARVGMIYQQFNLVRRLRVIDNVLVGRLPHLAGWRQWVALTRCSIASASGQGSGPRVRGSENGVYVLGFERHGYSFSLRLDPSPR